MAKPAVMFVCADNSGQSQLAGALLRRAMGELVEVRTAGTVPAAAVDQDAVTVLAEAGVELGDQPKTVDPLVLRRMDLTVVLGEQTPLAPVTGMSGPVETWVLADPAELGTTGVERMRVLRDELTVRVDELAADLRGILGLPEGREPGAELDPVTGAPVCRD